MPLSERHLQLATTINEYVNTTFERGGREEDILRTMIDYMGSFKQILDSTTPEQMDELCQRFDGFRFFASLMERLAKGIADGTLEVPRNETNPIHSRNVQTPLPSLTVNRQFMEAFIESEAPCFALGLVEERRQRCGFLALRPNEAIPDSVTEQGFRFGHSLYGSPAFVVIHFAFEFYGFGTYNVLLNPNNAVVQAVLKTMLEQRDYFFFALNPNNSVTAFRSEIGQVNLAGLESNYPRFVASQTSDAQYRKALTQFIVDADPPGTLLKWVCRDTVAALDLDNDRLEMSPRS